jgi:hypothetical protein
MTSAFAIRRWYSYSDETASDEFGVVRDGGPVTRLVIAAALHNPCAGRVTGDLSEYIAASRELGIEVGRRLRNALGDLRVESYGKACLVGTAGAYEHGNMLLTTTFANPVRDAVGGARAWIPSTGKRSGPGAAIDIPLAHKDELYVRSHYDTITITFPDAPSPDEIVIAFAVATGGRPNARVGGITPADVIGDGPR